MRWLPIPGCPCYEVSDGGEVRVVDRHVMGCGPTGRPLIRLRKGRILRPGLDARGYCQVGMYLHGDKTCSMRLVHRLVAAVFCGNPTGAKLVMHLDGNPRNNTAANLRWGSGTENNCMVAAHGRRKFSLEQVRLIRASCATNRALAREFDVSDVLISKVRHRRLYGHIV